MLEIKYTDTIFSQSHKCDIKMQIHVIKSLFYFYQCVLIQNNQMSLTIFT